MNGFTRPFKLFGLRSSEEYAKKVADHLEINLAQHVEIKHEDGEPFLKSGALYDDSAAGNVRGHDVFVIQSLFEDPTESICDKFMKLCIFCGSLKDASAHEVIVILPHLIFQRQDRKTDSRAPIATKYVASMLESVGVSRVVLFDVHNLAAAQNAFRIPVDNLEARNLFAEWCANKLIEEGITENIKILSPDSGGMGRCERFRNALLSKMRSKGALLDDIDVVVFSKVRVKGRVVGSRIIGDVENSHVIAYDDIISTGATMAKASAAVTASGGNIWAICATHGIFCGDANKHFDNLNTKIVVADTVSPFRLSHENTKKLHVIDTSAMIASALKRIHDGTGSISELLRN